MVDFFTNTNLGIVLLVLAQCLLVLIPLLVALAFLMYADRKIWAAVQMRRLYLEYLSMSNQISGP